MAQEGREWNAHTVTRPVLLGLDRVPEEVPRHWALRLLLNLCGMPSQLPSRHVDSRHVDARAKSERDTWKTVRTRRLLERRFLPDGADSAHAVRACGPRSRRWS